MRPITEELMREAIRDIEEINRHADPAIFCPPGFPEWYAVSVALDKLRAELPTLGQLCMQDGRTP